MAFLLKGYIPGFLNPETIFPGVVVLIHASQKIPQKLKLAYHFPGFSV